MQSLDLEGIRDEPAVASRLERAGLSPSAAAEKARLFAQAAEALPAGEPSAALRAFYVPGRIEVLGKHTDYAGGRSIVAAAERGFCVVARPRADARLCIAAGGGRRAEFPIEPDLVPAAGQWANYPMTVARRLARNFPGVLCGADVAFASDLPPAAGMSSSSAMVVATFLVLSAVNSLTQHEAYRRAIGAVEALAEYLGCVENGQSFGELAGDAGVGTFGGSEDHTAMLTCRAGELGQYSYCPLRRERGLAVPAGYVFAVAASGVVAEKTGQAMASYNRASLLAAEAVRAWNRATGRRDPHLAAAIASAPDAPRRIRQALRGTVGGQFEAAELVGRFEHFLGESEQIIPAAGDALAAEDLEEFGRQVDRSQGLAETLLGNQVPETVFLARSARSLGAAAASAFGAGFGGSVWALVERPRAEALLARWAGRYRVAFPGRAQGAAFFLTPAGVGSFQLP